MLTSGHHWGSIGVNQIRPFNNPQRECGMSSLQTCIRPAWDLDEQWMKLCDYVSHSHLRVDSTCDEGPIVLGLQ